MCISVINVKIQQKQVKNKKKYKMQQNEEEEEDEEKTQKLTKKLQKPKIQTKKTLNIKHKMKTSEINKVKTFQKKKKHILYKYFDPSHSNQVKPGEPK